MTESTQGPAPLAEQNQTVVSNSRQKTAAIRDLNDRFRRSLGGGRVVVTAGIHALGSERLQAILTKVTGFDGFTTDNDPYGEHDFGGFDDAGERVFWKIDYYDQSLSAGSPDPADPQKTCRVLTIMLASEY
jgi:hypothetical protein